MGVGWDLFTREKAVNIGVYSVGSHLTRHVPAGTRVLPSWNIGLVSVPGAGSRAEWVW